MSKLDDFLVVLPLCKLELGESRHCVLLVTANDKGRGTFHGYLRGVTLLEGKLGQVLKCWHV